MLVKDDHLNLSITKQPVFAFPNVISSKHDPYLHLQKRSQSKRREAMRVWKNPKNEGLSYAVEELFFWNIILREMTLFQNKGFNFERRKT